MYKRIAAIVLTLGLLLSGLRFEVRANEDTKAALNALLIGVRYDAESDPAKWSDEAVRKAIFGKMLWDDYLYSEESFLFKAGLHPLPSENRYLHFNIEDIQRLTRESFGRDFPTGIRTEQMFVKNDELIIARATGERTLLSVQDYEESGETVTAIGIALRNFSAYSEFLGFFEAIFHKAPETVYGYTLVSFKPIEGNQNFDRLTVSASSEMKGIDAMHNAEIYYAANAIDGNPDTFWAEGVRGVGVNEWIQFAAAEGEKLYLSAIGFSMGERKDGTLLEEKGRPSKIAIELENGFCLETELPMQDDVIVLQEPVAVDWVKITVLDAIAGNLHDATCISEIRLLGLDANAYFPGREPMPTEPETEPVQEIETTEEIVTTEAPQTLPTQASTQATEPVTEELVPEIDLAGSIDVWIWGMIAIVLVGGAICAVVLIMVLKKKGSL